VLAEYLILVDSLEPCFYISSQSPSYVLTSVPAPANWANNLACTTLLFSCGMVYPGNLPKKDLNRLRTHPSIPVYGELENMLSITKRNISNHWGRKTKQEMNILLYWY
jgi:hypothetical protein